MPAAAAGDGGTSKVEVVTMPPDLFPDDGVAKTGKEMK